MTEWFLLALIPPFLFALGNHIDKTLLEKHFKVDGVSTLLLISLLTAGAALPVLLVWNAWQNTAINFGDGFLQALSLSLFDLINIDFATFCILTALGLLGVGILWFYLEALDSDETSAVVILYQPVSVFALILGYFILGETINLTQGIAMTIIITGTLVMGMDFLGGGLKTPIRTTGYMLLASFCWALESVLFKKAALGENVVFVLFWEHLIIFCVGLLIYTFANKTRTVFIAAVRENSKSILLLNLANEALYITASFIISFVFMMKQVTLVQLTQSFQPIFALLIAVVWTYYAPHTLHEDLLMNKRAVAQRATAIVITLIGIYILLSCTDC